VVDHSLPFTSTREADIEISSCTEHPPGAGDDDAFDSLVQVEHWIDQFEITHHVDGEGIALLWPVEGQDYHGGCFGCILRVVRYFDILDWEGCVGLRDLDLERICEHVGIEYDC
jgi:hypothetical protein